MGERERGPSYIEKVVRRKRYRGIMMRLRGAAVEREHAEDVFRLHSEKWKAETRHFSMIIQIATHPSYQRIIGLGKDALPLILRDLEKHPSQWFWALAALTGENPVRPEDAGNVRAMQSAWLDWGRRNGYL